LGEDGCMRKPPKITMNKRQGNERLERDNMKGSATTILSYEKKYFGR